MRKVTRNKEASCWVLTNYLIREEISLTEKNNDDISKT